MSNFTSIFRKSLLTTICIGTLSQNAFAEEDIGIISLEDLLNIEVTTASRSAESASEAPGTLVVIPRRQIIERGYRNLEDIMRDLPGVENQKASDPVPYNRVTIRGVQGNSKFVILQNGIRISSPTGEEIPIAANFPLYHIKQVEIVFGPASALYGADAFTGVINMITYNDADEIEDSLALEFGSDGYSYGHFMSGFNWGENTNIVVSGHIQEDDHIDYASEYPELFEINDLIDFGGFVAVPAEQRSGPEFPTESKSIFASLKSHENFTLGFNYSEFKNSTGLSTRPDFVDFQIDAGWKTELTSIYGKYSMKINDSVSSDVQASYSIYEVDPQTKFTNIFVGYTDGFKYAKGSKAELGQQFFINLSDNSNLILGYVFEQFNSIPKTGDLPAPYDPDVSSSDQGLSYLGTNGALPIQIFEINYNSKGAFAQFKHKWSDTMTGVVGLRYDDSSSYGSTTNPRAGLVWTGVENFTFKLLYGQAFLAPAPKAAYENFGGFVPFPDDDGIYQSSFFHVPNPSLEPEEMETLELNVNYRATDNLNLTATLYSEEVDNLIMIAPLFPTDSDFVEGGNIAFTQSNQNIGILEAEGLDLGFIYQTELGSGSLQLFGSASFVDGEVTAQGSVTDLPFTSEKKYKLGATYRRGNFFMTPSIYHIGETHASEIGENIGHNLDSYTLINLYAGYEDLLKNLDLHLRIENLADKKYYSAGLGGFDFVDVPQETRRFSLGMTYRF